MGWSLNKWGYFDSRLNKVEHIRPRVKKCSAWVYSASTGYEPQMLYLLNQWMLTCYTQPPFDPLYVYFYDWKRKYTRYNLGCESNEGSKVGWCTLEWTGKHLIWILKSFQHLTEVKITRVMECSLYKHFEANEYWTGEIEGILQQMNGDVELMYALLWVWSELWHPAELKFWKSIWKVGRYGKCRLSLQTVLHSRLLYWFKLPLSAQPREWRKESCRRVTLM